METAIIISFLTLTFLEIVLGIDNIIFMSIVSDQLPQEKQGLARNIGLGLATLIRLLLLLVISWINTLEKTLITINEFNLCGRDIILAIGGFFLIYKSTGEIFAASEGEEEHKKKKRLSFSSAIFQITIINIIFSVDSILTAVGLTNNIPVMAFSVIGSTAIMIFFSKAVSKFINKHKSLKVLALSFILMVGMFLLLDASHIHVPKGYIYVAIGFSLFVETMNIRKKNRK